MRYFLTGVLTLSLLAGCATTQSTTETASVEQATAEIQPIPEGFTTGPVPHLVVAGATDALAFYEKALGAQKIHSFAGKDGKVMHAMMKMGDSMFSLSDECPKMGSLGPKALGGTPATFYVYTDDVDSAFANAVAAGATSKEEPSYMFWGDRVGTVIDPYGHRWSLATHMVDVSEERMAEDAKTAMTGTMPEQPADAKPLPKPEGWTTLTVMLTVDDVDATIAYYEQTLGAITVDKMEGPEGTLHAELKIRDQVIMLGKAQGDYKSAQTLGGSPVTLQYYVENPDQAFATAVENGGKSVMPPQDMFWGDRWGEFIDPAGVRWGVAVHVEDVTQDEMRERMPDSMEMGMDTPQG